MDLLEKAVGIGRLVNGPERQHKIDRAGDPQPVAPALMSPDSVGHSGSLSPLP